MRKSFYSTMELIGNLKTYEWGKLGRASKVAQLACLNDDQFEIDENKPYAELWMGAHVSGPSTIKATGESLADLVQCDLDLPAMQQNLPFLFKVLSINKALSIQVHPNLTEAERLHAEFPDIYKDPNHKPEMAIALTPFVALCGFRPNEEIYKNLMQSPEMIKMLSMESIDAVKSDKANGIKNCFAKLMCTSQSDISMCIENITERFELEQRSDDIATYFTRLQCEFPNDIGILCLFFLNIIKLEPGQALFLGANEIHAYLEGDCMECMACSDNVIRAGLTPKFKDVPTLLRLLDYTGAPSSDKIFKPTQHPTLKYTNIFSPPVKDCAVAEIKVPASDPFYKIENRSCGSIFIVLAGTGIIEAHSKIIPLTPGSIIFLPGVATDQEIEEFPLEVTSECDFVAYQAMYNDFLETCSI